MLLDKSRNTHVADCLCWCLAPCCAGGAPEPLLLLSPLLLMLSQDPLLLRQLGERQRYLPPVLAFSGYLAVTTALQVCYNRQQSSTCMGCCPGLSGTVLSVLQ